MRRLSICMVTLGLIGVGGCPPPVPPDDFNIILSSTARTAQRTGTSTTETNDDVFNCRATSVSPDILPADAYFPNQPNHRMTLTDSIAGLSVRVDSSDELVLWIRFGGSNFCNEVQEDSIGRGSWTAGEYDVFIGAPNPGATIDYTLVIE